jgi:hypothetical protein
MAGQRSHGTADGDAGSTHEIDRHEFERGEIERGRARSRRAARTGLALWISALVVGTALFHAIGDGHLSAPPLAPSGWSAWAAGRDPLIATFAVLRLLVLALSWYLVGVTSIGVLARVLRAASLIRLADALTLPALRRVLQGALGVSLATAMVVSSVPAPDRAARERSTVTLPAGAEATVTPHGATVPMTLAALGDEDRITLEHVESGRPMPLELLERARERAEAAEREATSEATPDDTADRGGLDPQAPDRQAPAREAAPAGGGDGHVVVTGDSFWTIAQEALAERSGQTPTDAETATYWRQLVEANRDRLVDRDNPDLIFPGQRLVVPSSAPAGPDGTGEG